MCRYFSFTKMFIPIVVILASNQNIQEDIEKFMDGVQENINFYKEYAKDEASQDFTMLHIANYDIGLYDLCSIYQSVYRRFEAEEMVSVITVRNKFGSNLTPKEYLNDLMSSLKNYIYHEKGYKSLNSMELSVNYIKQKHIIDFDMITTTDTMIGRVKREFNASVIEASIEIAYAIFSEIIKDSFENALIYVLNQVLQQNEDTITDSYGDLILYNLMRRLNPLRIENLSIAKLLTKPNSRLKVIFDVLCEKNVEYEKQLGFSYFTVHNDYAVDLFVSLLEKKHKKLIDGFIRSILYEHIMALEHPNNMETTVERFTITCDEIIKCIGPIQKDSNSDVILSCYSSSLHKLLAEENFVDSFEFYFEFVSFHDLKVSLEDTYNEIIAKMCQELRNENTTRIVINDMITPDSLHKLWRIFTRTNIINNTYHNQSIFIDNGKTLSAKKLAKSRMLESCIFNLMSQTTYAATDNITMEVFFTKQEMNEGCDDDRTDSKIYKICTFKKPVKDHKILIGYIGNRGDKSIKIETHKCIVPDENLSVAIVNYIKQGAAMDIDIISLHTISVSIDTTTTYLYIAHCAETDTGKEGILLTYNVQKTDENENYADLGYPDRRFRCFYKVSGSLLNELNKHLQYLHLLAGNELKIPNILLMDEIEMFYTEEVITMEQFLCSIKHSNFIRTKPDKIQDFCDTTLMLSYKELLDYGNIINIAKEKQIAEFAKELGILEEDFYRILNKLILGVDWREKTEDCHYTIDEDKNKKTYDLCTTYHPNGNKVLHVCDVHFQNNQHFFTVNLTDVLHKILENEDVSKMLSTLSLEAETSCGTRTVTMLVNIMCKEINYYDTFYRKFNSNAKDKIEERLVKVVAEYLSCKQQLYEPSPHTVFTDTQKEFFHMFTQKYKEECLKKLVEMIHTELSEQARKKMVKIISLMPLSKRTFLCDMDVVENASDNNFIDLENFEYQDCHKLQEPTKK